MLLQLLQSARDAPNLDHVILDAIVVLLVGLVVARLIEITVHLDVVLHHLGGLSGHAIDVGVPIRILLEGLVALHGRGG